MAELVKQLAIGTFIVSAKQRLKKSGFGRSVRASSLSLSSLTMRRTVPALVQYAMP